MFGGPFTRSRSTPARQLACRNRHDAGELEVELLVDERKDAGALVRERAPALKPGDSAFGSEPLRTTPPAGSARLRAVYPIKSGAGATPM